MSFSTASAQDTIPVDSTFHNTDKQSVVFQKDSPSDSVIHYINEEGFGQVLVQLEKARAASALDTLYKRLGEAQDSLSTIRGAIATNTDSLLSLQTFLTGKYKEALEASEELHPGFFDRLLSGAEIWLPITAVAYVAGSN